MRAHIWRNVAVVLCTIVVVLGTVILVAMQPRVANHFGYALPGRDGLPTYVFANGRRYHSEQTCAGDTWCRTGIAQDTCITEAQAVRSGQGRLVQVGSMFTLFGPPHPILSVNGSHDLTASLFVAKGQDCYVVYSLEGGP